MKRLLILVAFFTYQCVIAQAPSSDINTEIDQLKAPQTPAAVMLGIAESEITRPSDVSDFIASLRQATSGFTSVPLNYAIEFSPHWIWNKKTSDAKSFLSNDIGNNIKHSFTISVANNNNDVQSISQGPIRNTAIATGIRFSFLRGNISDSTKAKLNTVNQYMASKNKTASQSSQATMIEDLNKIMLTKIEAVEQIANLTEAQKQTKIDSIVQYYETHKSTLTAQAFDQPDIDDKIHEILEALEFERKGWKLDFNSAIAWRFPDQSYSRRALDQTGAWLSGGYEFQNNISILCLLRYQYFSDNALIGRTKNSALDGGARLLYTRSKFTLSAELVYRNNIDIEDQKYKYLINLDYKIGDNQKLNLSFGKDFNGVFTKDGNVISALNFLMGFGNKRKVSDKA